MKNGESRAVRTLLAQSSPPYKRVLAGLEETDVKGWRNIRPGAVYNLRVPHQPPPGARRNRGVVRASKPRASESSQPAWTDTTSYMSGELDRSYNYVYRGGLSKHAGGSEPLPYLPLPPLPASQCRAYSCVHLDTALSRNRQPERDMLARIVAMQLKPELLVEQIVIENRLRTMNFGDLHRLNLEGVGVDPKSIHKLDKGMWFDTVKSRSAPVLSRLQNPVRRTTKRRKQARQPLDWCTLNNTDAARILQEDPGPNLGLGSPRGGLGGPQGDLGGIMEGANHFGMEGGRDHLSMERSLLETREALAGTTSYRLPANPQDPPRPLHMQHRCLQEAGEQAKVRETVPNHHTAARVPVVSPTLRPMQRPDRWEMGVASGAEQIWRPERVKYTSKLRSLGW